MMSIKNICFRAQSCIGRPTQVSHDWPTLFWTSLWLTTTPQPSSWTLPSKDLLNIRVRILWRFRIWAPMKMCVGGVAFPGSPGASLARTVPQCHESVPRGAPLCLAFPSGVSWLCMLAVLVLRFSGWFGVFPAIAGFR